MDIKQRRVCAVRGEHEKKVVATRFVRANERNEATKNEEVDGA